MGTLLVLIMLAIVLNDASLRWGLDSAEKIDIPEWERRSTWNMYLLVEKRHYGMVPNTEQHKVDQVKVLTPPARIVFFFALAFSISWCIWFVMRAAAIQPILGPNFSTSPGYLLLLVRCGLPYWSVVFQKDVQIAALSCAVYCGGGWE
jgi:hypothetical protein